MDLKHLTAMVTVADVGSVTRAAELLHVVQPAVTRQIRALEQELGVELFERTRHGMRLTKAGEVMVDRARRALLELERARAEIRPTPGQVIGVVQVGLLESTAELIAEPLVSALAQAHPGIQLHVITGYSGHLQRWLDDGDLDLSLLYNLASTPALHVQPLADERLWAVAPADAGLMPERPVSVAEAASHPMVMPAAGHGLSAVLDTAFASAGVTAEVSVRTNSMQLQKLFVQAGLGWTILPGVGIAIDHRSGLISAAPLYEPEVRRSIVIGMRRTGRPSAATDVVAAELTNQVRMAVQNGTWPASALASAVSTDPQIP